MSGTGDFYLAVQEDLAEVGIDIELEPLDPAMFNQLCFEPAAGSELRSEVVRGDPIFPLDRVVENLSEKTIYFPGSARPAGFEELKEQALQTEDPADIMALCEKMEKLAYEDVMFVSLWTNPMMSTIHPKVHDIAFAYGGVPFSWYKYAWIEK